MANPVIDFEVKAQKEWDKAQKALYAAGTKDMQKRLRKIMTEVTKPTRAKVKQSARDNLPKSGGLNKWAAVTPSANTDFRADSAGVKIRMSKKGHDMKALDRGRVRHPLFGNKKVWIQESITPGFFTRPITADAIALRGRIEAGVSQYLEELARKAS